MEKIIDKSVKIYTNRLEDFMVDFLKKETGKNFFKMHDETSYRYSYYEEYSSCISYFVFEGVKCVNKTFRTVEELLEGVKNKEVVLFHIGSERLNNQHHLLSDNQNFRIEELKKQTKIKELPFLTLVEGAKAKELYAKLYPNLEEKLTNFVNSTALKHLEYRMESIKENIYSNEKEMNEEIAKIKLEYQTQLKEDEKQYSKLANEYETKRQKIANIVKNSEAKKQVNSTENLER